MVTLVQRHPEFSFAILQADSDQAFVPASPTPASALEGRNLVLGAFLSVKSRYMTFYNHLAFVTSQALASSRHEHHGFFCCPAFAGNGGGVLLSGEGSLVGLHMA